MKCRSMNLDLDLDFDLLVILSMTNDNDFEIKAMVFKTFIPIEMKLFAKTCYFSLYFPLFIVEKSL